MEGLPRLGIIELRHFDVVDPIDSEVATRQIRLFQKSGKRSKLNRDVSSSRWGGSRGQMRRGLGNHECFPVV
jgi:hypothetical protein